VRFDLLDELEKVSIRIGNRVSEVNLHILTMKIELELQLICGFASSIPAQPLDKLSTIALVLSPLIRFGA
jgi:hypothetical protein